MKFQLTHHFFWACISSCIVGLLWLPRSKANGADVCTAVNSDGNPVGTIDTATNSITCGCFRSDVSNCTSVLCSSINSCRLATISNSDQVTCENANGVCGGLIVTTPPNESTDVTCQCANVCNADFSRVRGINIDAGDGLIVCKDGNPPSSSGFRRDACGRLANAFSATFLGRCLICQNFGCTPGSRLTFNGKPMPTVTNEFGTTDNDIGSYCAGNCVESDFTDNGFTQSDFANCAIAEAPTNSPTSSPTRSPTRVSRNQVKVYYYYLKRLFRKLFGK